MLFAAATLLHAQSARALVATDRAVARSSGAVGLAAALDTVLADDAVLVFPGAPILRGRGAILGFLRRQAPGTQRVQWDATFLEVSADTALAVTYGSTFVRSSDSLVGNGRFGGAWRRSGGTWKLLALCLAGLPSAATVITTAAESAQAGVLPRTPGTNPFARADSSFAARAGRDRASTAFAAFAAEDAALVGTGSAPMVRGAAIGPRMAVGGADGSHWSWWPVFAAGDSAGGIGVTVGQAEIRDTTAAGGVTYSEYLTLWRRRNGIVQFIADLGDPWPRRN